MVTAPRRTAAAPGPPARAEAAAPARSRRPVHEPPPRAGAPSAAAGGAAVPARPPETPSPRATDAAAARSDAAAAPRAARGRKGAAARCAAPRHDARAHARAGAAAAAHRRARPGAAAPRSARRPARRAGAGAVTLNVSDFPFAWYMRRRSSARSSEEWTAKGAAGPPAAGRVRDRPERPGLQAWRSRRAPATRLRSGGAPGDQRGGPVSAAARGIQAAVLRIHLGFNSPRAIRGEPVSTSSTPAARRWRCSPSSPSGPCCPPPPRAARPGRRRVPQRHRRRRRRS